MRFRMPPQACQGVELGGPDRHTTPPALCRFSDASDQGICLMDAGLNEQKLLGLHARW